MNWYENIEGPIRNLVKYLRDNGINTECSCGHKMYIQCQYLPDGEIMRIHNLLYDYLHDKNKKINFEIHLVHKVENGHSFDTLNVQFPEESTIPWREAFPNYNPSVALKGARHKESLTQEQLAKLLGISRGTLSKMENNKRPINKQMAMCLSKILNINYKVLKIKKEKKE